jgi:hypothetical protein
MATRTRKGITVTNVNPEHPQDTTWRTLNGRYKLLRVYAYTECENPHPGCPGGEFHEYLVGWRYEGASKMPDVAQTFNEALDALADHLAANM